MFKGLFFGTVMTLAVFWPTIYNGFHYEMRNTPSHVNIEIPPIPDYKPVLVNQNSNNG